MNNPPSSDITALFRQPRLIEEAVARAYRLALVAHKREGVPIAAWRGNRVVWIPADEIEIPPEADTAELDA